MKFEYEFLSSLATPAYLYSAELIRGRVKALQDALPASFSIFYSLKANSNPEILEVLRGSNVKADIASAGEMKAAVTAGFLPIEMEFTGPGKSRAALELAVQNQIGAIVIESFGELALIQEICSRQKTEAQVAVRIHPPSYLLPSGKLISSSASQFGIEWNQLPEFLSRLKDCGSVHLRGFHIYNQSHMLNSDFLLENFRLSWNYIREAAEIWKSPIQFLNLGGGFGIPYFEKETELNLAALAPTLNVLAAEMSSHPLTREAQVFVESGRYLTGPAGIYVTQVLYRKSSAGKNYGVLSGGLSHHLAAAGFGQLLRKNFRLEIVQKNPSDLKEKITLVGPSCYSLDTLAQEIELPVLEVGDFICVQNSGAYGASFSPQNFLRFDPAAEIMLSEP